MVAGPDGPAPVVGRTVKVSSSAPAGTGAGSGRVAVDSSARSNGIEPSLVCPASTTMAPAQPRSPDPQVTCRPAAPAASGVMVVEATASSEGKVTPVGVLSPSGSKQPSNSK